MKFGHNTKGAESYAMAVERSGPSALVWSLDLPGCSALVPAGADTNERAALAVLEYLSWSHQRSAERLQVDESQIVVSQTLETGAQLDAGDTTAFFLHDGEAAQPKEFPLWANAHDLALDELRQTVTTLPPAFGEHRLYTAGRTLTEFIEHAVVTERFFAGQLQPGSASPHGRPGQAIRDLQDAHTLLQQVVCGVPSGLITSGQDPSRPLGEHWSVRKVMRRSIWHLRYHTWELRRSVGAIWLG
jgi:hypothetical protein